MGDKTTVTVRMSRDCRRGWDKACQRYGVTLTALVEAIGCDLLDHGGTTSKDRGPALIERAREIDRERRSRR